MKVTEQCVQIISFWSLAVYSLISGHLIRADFSLALSLLIVALNMAVLHVFHR
jgi:hypothetical protein